jgi:hypothetical protein
LGAFELTSFGWEQYRVNTAQPVIVLGKQCGMRRVKGRCVVGGISIPDPIRLEFPLDVDATVTADASVTLLGDPSHPVAAQLKLLGDAEQPVAAQVQLLGDTQRPVSAQVQLIGDPQRPVSAKVGLAVMLENLPILSREDVFRILKRRIRLPFNFRFGVSVFPLNLFGVDAVQVSICGEPQLITDDYVPNAYERCEVECEPCQP